MMNQSINLLEHNLARLIPPSVAQESESVPVPPTKSVSESEKWRHLGNEHYRLKDYEAALKYFSTSVATAPADSIQLAFAFGNRSAVLLGLHKHELCLLDVNRALAILKKPSFSENEIHNCKEKLLERKTKSWDLLQKENKIKARIRESRKPFLLLERRVYHYIHQMSRDECDLIIDYSTFDDPVWSTKFDNPLLSNFSSKVKLEYNETLGQHWVATQNIDPGEILGIENLVLLRTTMNADISYDYCTFCLLRCEALIPCPTCTWQMYCSERCRQKAFNLYHRVECKVLPFLIEYKDYILLAFRIFLIGTKQGSELRILMNNPDVYECLEGKRSYVGVPYPHDYLSILNLKSVIDDEPLHSDLNCRRFSLVGIIFDALRRANFFESEPNKEESSCDASDDKDRKIIESFTSLLLLHHLKLADSCNANLYIHLLTLSEENNTIHKNDLLNKIGIYVGSYRTISNHSCCPNAWAIRERKRQLFFSSKPIKAGEQIFLKAVLCYEVMPIVERKLLFETVYRIECNCRACEENWPLMKDLLSTNNIYLTANPRSIEKVEVFQTWLMKLTTEPLTLRTDHEKQMRHVIAFRRSVQPYVKEPSAVLLICEQFITECMTRKANQHFLPSTTYFFSPNRLAES